MNPIRPASPALSVLLLTAALAACSPAFNWREVRPENTALTALLPCKPDKGSKTVPLGGQPTELAMTGCETQGVTFAIAVADVGDAAKTVAVLTGWQTATLTNMRAVPASTVVTPFKLPGAAAATLVAAQGARGDGKAVQSRAAYFAHGTQVFQAVMYADKIDPAVADAFFSGLKLP